MLKFFCNVVEILKLSMSLHILCEIYFFCFRQCHNVMNSESIKPTSASYPKHLTTCLFFIKLQDGLNFLSTAVADLKRFL